MARYVALLRSINVGGRNKVPMGELRSLFESLGHTEVATYIQSGNVVFTSSAPVSAVDLGAEVAERFAVATTVVLRDGSQLDRVVRANPFAGIDLTKLHVGFMAGEPAGDAVLGLDAAPFAPEELAIRGREVYLHLPDGMARTRLPAYLDRRLRVPTTIRNWNTVTKLLELACSCAGCGS